MAANGRLYCAVSFAWLTPRPRRNRPGWAASRAAQRSAVSRASCCQMLRMPVATVIFEVASISGAACSMPLLPPSQSAP